MKTGLLYRWMRNYNIDVSICLDWKHFEIPLNFKWKKILVKCRNECPKSWIMELRRFMLWRPTCTLISVTSTMRMQSFSFLLHFCWKVTFSILEYIVMFFAVMMTCVLLKKCESNVNKSFQPFLSFLAIVLGTWNRIRAWLQRILSKFYYRKI